MNRNETLKWIQDQTNGIIVDERMKDSERRIRGVYGIFVSDGVEEKCVYVGKTDSFYSRMFVGNGHICRLIRGNHFIKELNTVLGLKKIIFKVLEEVPFLYDYYHKDIQRLATAENHYIDKYQSMNQSLNQVPEGTKVTEVEWKEAKLEYEKNR